jgi:hypothetical protein
VRISDIIPVIPRAALTVAVGIEVGVEVGVEVGIEVGIEVGYRSSRWIVRRLAGED